MIFNKDTVFIILTIISFLYLAAKFKCEFDEERDIARGMSEKEARALHKLNLNPLRLLRKKKTPVWETEQRSPVPYESMSADTMLRREIRSKNSKERQEHTDKPVRDLSFLDEGSYESVTLDEVNK